MTPTIKALNILSETDYNKPMSARAFSRLMWPDSPMHTKHSNHGNGNGGCVGKAAWLAGGSFLSKLKKKKLVYRNLYNDGGGYYISSEGRKFLVQNLADNVINKSKQ